MEEQIVIGPSEEDRDEKAKCSTIAAQLQSMPPRHEHNPLHGLGLIGPFDVGPGSHGAILRYEKEGHTPHVVTIGLPKTGEPKVGTGVHPTDESDQRAIKATVEHTMITMPGESFTGLDLSRLREWWDNFECEELLTRMTGFRGNDHYVVFRKTQGDVQATAKASSLSDTGDWPEIWKRMHSVNPITRPTWLLNGWSKPGEQTENDHDFTAVAKWSGDMPFEWLYEFHGWLRGTCRSRNGYRLYPAMLYHSPEKPEDLISNTDTLCFVMLVSNEIAHQIRMDSRFFLHKEVLQNMVSDQSFKNRFLCKVGNLLIAESDRMPKFNAGPNRFSRALVFGARSMVCGYFFEKQYKQIAGYPDMPHPTVFDCWTSREMQGMLGCRASYGSKVLSITDPTTKEITDCGRVAVDLQEG